MRVRIRKTRVTFDRRQDIIRKEAGCSRQQAVLRPFVVLISGVFCVFGMSWTRTPTLLRMPCRVVAEGTGAARSGAVRAVSTYRRIRALICRSCVLLGPTNITACAISRLVAEYSSDNSARLPVVNEIGVNSVRTYVQCPRTTYSIHSYSYLLYFPTNYNYRLTDRLRFVCNQTTDGQFSRCGVHNVKQCYNQPINTGIIHIPRRRCRLYKCLPLWIIFAPSSVLLCWLVSKVPTTKWTRVTHAAVTQCVSPALLCYWYCCYYRSCWWCARSTLPPASPPVIWSTEQHWIATCTNTCVLLVFGAIDTSMSICESCTSSYCFAERRTCCNLLEITTSTGNDEFLRLP